MAGYRVGLVGCGARQSAHIAAFRAVEGCEIVAVADLLEDLRAEFAQKNDIPAAYGSVKEMVTDAGVDLVAVVTRAIWMRQPVLDALEAGAKGVLVEKPFGVDIEDSKAMLEAAEAAGAALLVNHQYRFFELTDQMREILLGGELGEVEYLRAIGAVKLHGQGTHMIDFVRYLYQDRPFAWALGNFAGAETFDAKQPGPDFDVGVLTFDDGIPLYVESGPGSMRAPFPEDRLNLYADAVCTRGRIWFGLSRGLRIWWPDGRYEEVPGSWPEISGPAQVRLVESLIEAVEQGTESRCDARKAYATQEALCALLESALSHRRVTFPADIAPGLMERVRAAAGG